MSATTHSVALNREQESGARLQWAALLLVSGVGGTWSGLPVLSGAILFPLLLTATVTDVQSRRIPNWLTYGTLLIALTAAAAVSAMTTAGFDGHLVGIALSESLAGFAGTFGVMLLIYVLFGTGAGDVKLAGAIGACVGVELGLEVLLWTHISAGCAMGVFLCCRIGPRWLVQQAGSRVLPHLIPMPVKDHSDLLHYPVPMALFFAIGTVAALLEVPLP